MSLILSGTDGLSAVDGSAATPAIRGADENTGIFFPAADTIAFSEGGSESMRIDSSGNLLVGTTTSRGKITSEQSGSDWALGLNHTNAGTQSFTSFRYAGTLIGQITGNNTNTSYTTSSDYRLKNTIAPMTGALAKVALLKPCTYKWKVDGSDGQGFIAHELAEVVPQCVTGEKDAVDADGNPVYQGVDTSFLVATLTAAIQEQQALITTLTDRITALEAK
jgi:hypothetical protein